MFYLNLKSKFRNFRIILTSKYIILINMNGFLKFKTNFYNIDINNNNLYINLNNYINILEKKTNMIDFFFKINQNNKKLLNFSNIYLLNIFNNIYTLEFFNNICLNIKGIGYKFSLENKKLIIRVGYSHYIIYNLKNYIYYFLKNNTCIILYSNNKYNLKKIAAFIKSYKKINLYKENGIFYNNELLIFKQKEKRKI